MADLVPVGAGERLEPFARAGVLESSDIHLANLVCRIGGETNGDVSLAVALSCRELRRGSVFWDPHEIADVVRRQVLDPAIPDIESSDQAALFAELDWPDPGKWLTALKASPVVADREDPLNRLPARLDDGMVYLEKYWQAEHDVARDLAVLAADPPSQGPVSADDVVANVSSSLAASGIVLDPAQADAAVAAITHRISVLAGGPGTGKTTTVCTLLAALQQADPRLGAVALAAPSGKAAARLRDSVSQVSERMPDDLKPLVADAATVHSLLKWQGPGTSFGYDEQHKLPFGVVVVDEASMLSLPLAANLLSAIGPGTRLILVGDPGQLVSVDAGSVLADIVSSADTLQARLPVTILTHNHRSRGDIARLSEAVREGDTSAALDILVAAAKVTPPFPDDSVANSDRHSITWIDADPASITMSDLPAVANVIARTGAHMLELTEEGADAAALKLVDAHRLLCAHREGPYGVDEWSQRMVAVLSDVLPGVDQSRWALGETAIVTHNLAQLGINNGDCGVVVETRPIPTVALPGPGGAPRRLPCSLIPSLQPLQAMTIHKAQGSQFTDVTVILPPPDSPLLTRELFYTAITRAREHLSVVGTKESVERAIDRANDRRSGIQRRWEENRTSSCDRALNVNVPSCR
ncbi:exodeoxyribonuclease V subunit alpha [Propionibacterium sp. NM47_B9-13]|uniref:RecBCD enzyme subunit RecD n=2 Tax=Cutibacterium modestum TaxID=2559073 RepID=A0AAD1NUQ4_9ACTN|nr:exodeoxyribonuclease V subunit alpha [Cutibacterium modestum]TGY29148.1 exodeoxyribonuclease V subunit alpha [Propionibacterium sp. NM47_B9-13]AOH45067.1 exodeoxyribonuclease V subunit alpha [Cutibacterium modestum]EFS91342.1 exodeoxyribonuclease V, alpha subunit [Cutibacterium modestum HL044PA1]MCP2376066.1 exonuclease V subunit alpha [Cutibacterium modestum 28N]MCP2381370.1 exonuclease V subunit alpha [Cutibacterium modestum 30N]